jgi:hypothetical protein
MNKKVIYIVLVAFIGAAIGAFTLSFWMMNQSRVIMNTKELYITQMEFTTLSDSDVIILHFKNSGTLQVTVDAVKLNGDTQNKITGDSVHGLTFEPGDSGTITIEHDWTTGNSYTARLFTSDGTLVGSFQDTA